MPTPVTELDLLRLSSLPPSKVVAWFKAKGYAISWDWRDVWQQQHARAFTVAKAANDDILRALRDGVDQAVTNGWSERRFIQEMTPRLQQMGWWGQQSVVNPTGNLQLVQLGSPWRLKTIYRTNMYTSFATGRYRTLVANGHNRPIWVYDAMNDSLTRDSHRALDNRAWRYDDPIWKRIYPPCGFNCRCQIRALTEEQAAQRGISVSTDQNLPAGFPDDGWDFNPAEQTIEQLMVKVAPKPRTLAQRIGEISISAIIDGIMRALRGERDQP